MITIRQRGRRTAILTAVGLVLGVWIVQGNHLQIDNVSVGFVGDTRAYIEFDITWENSWRMTNFNHDAAWVFFKIRKHGDLVWKHVTLLGDGVTPAGYVTGTGTPIEMIVPSDRMGLFIRRAEEGRGTVSVSGARIVWDFDAAGFVDTDRVRAQAFGIEMVYVAEGPFWVGSGFPTAGDAAARENNAFTDGAWVAGAPSIPFRITSEDALAIGPDPGKLWAAGQIEAATLPAEFPKGYQAFYCMKYEVTQGQYVDFLNALSRAHQIRNIKGTALVLGQYALNNSASLQNRHSIRTKEVPDEPAPAVFGCDFDGDGSYQRGRDLTVNHVDAWVGNAITDWMGLRPMTELEFEKACRGPMYPVPGEFAWGTTNILRTQVPENLTDDGKGIATATVGNCNFNNSGKGPVRSGLWAMSATTREASGASYWGIMELSGNQNARVASVGNSTGRAFNGSHGNGELSANGDADAPTWVYANRGYTGGVGERGGDYTQNLSGRNPRVSDRSRGLQSNVDAWSQEYGWRAVRTAPAGIGP